MTILFVEGDVFHLNTQAIAHGCNCAGAMGRGIAVEFRRRYPEMYRQYREKCQDGSFKLGSAFAYEAEDGKMIYNLGTQEHWTKQADLDSIQAAVRRMIDHAADFNIETIAIPQIGAGLGGLRWEDVKERLIYEAEDSGMVELFVVEKWVKPPNA